VNQNNQATGLVQAIDGRSILKNGSASFTIIGTVGNDPKVEVSRTGNTYLRVSLAVNRGYMKDEKWVDTLDWFTVFLRGKRAEGVAKFLSKGMAVFVRGDLRTFEQELQDGSKMTRTILEPAFGSDGFIVAGEPRPRRDHEPPDEVPRPSARPGWPEARPESVRTPRTETAEEDPPSVLDDDLPF
jgi:single stranded DNA-binding protein